MKKPIVMKNCEAISLELPGYVNGKLEPQAAGPVRLHLQSCDACQAEVSQLRRLEVLLSKHLPVIKPSPTFASTFANRLAAEIAVEGKREQAREEGSLLGWLFRPWLIPVAAAAALGALLLTPWLSQRPATNSVIPTVGSVGGVASAKKPAINTAANKGDVKAESKLAAAAPATDKSTETASAPPSDVIQRPELFVDYAVIRDLDVLEGEDGTG